jgi:hypothetical protein
MYIPHIYTIVKGLGPWKPTGSRSTDRVAGDRHELACTLPVAAVEYPERLRKQTLQDINIDSMIDQHAAFDEAFDRGEEHHSVGPIVL